MNRSVGPRVPIPVVIEDDLVDAVRRTGTDGARDLGDVGRPATPGLLVDLIAIVPGAIGAEDDALHDRPSRFSDLDGCSERGGRYQIREIRPAESLWDPGAGGQRLWPVP